VIHVVREADGPPAGTIVLLHGRGADEHDLLPLLGELDPHRRHRGITLGAPMAIPSAGRHWYAVPRVGYPDPASFAATWAELTAFVDDELALDWPTTVIGGFSQGGVMSYASGWEPDGPSRWILAMSSFIPTVPGWAPDLASRAGLPVAHVHGTLDPVISVAFGRQAKALLEAGGADLL